MKDRQPWLDALRGVAVLAVVMFHSVLFITAAGNEVDGVTSAISTSLGSLRMPVLFTLSGLLASRSVAAGIRERSTLIRAARSYYLYACWLVVYFVSCLFLPDDVMWHINGPKDLLLQALVPNTPLWYLFALGIFTLLLAALRRVPSTVVVGAFAILAVATGYLPPTIRWWALGSQMLSYGVFFALGARAPELVWAVARGRVLSKALVALGVMAVLELIDARSTTFVTDVPIDVLQGAATVGFAICASVLLTRWRLVRAPLQALGRRTLPIYVLHVPLLWALFSHGSITGSRSAALPYLLTAGIVAVALLLYAGASRLPGARLLFALPTDPFRQPSWLSRRVRTE